MDGFLAASEIVDWRNPRIIELAERLAGGASQRIDFVRHAFEWVRDEIRHTGDFELDAVTCSASEVLNHKTGYCYAKCHLLVALCRARGIPAGFGYQRLSINGEGEPFCLHGFAAVHLGEHGWRRLDPRGNKCGIVTEFSESVDSLAFTATVSGEVTFSTILVEPLAVVIEALRRFPNRADFCNHLPDLAGFVSTNG